MIAVQILRNYWLQITRLLGPKIPKTTNDSQKPRCSIENQIIRNSDFVGKKNFSFADVWVLETT